MKTRVMKEKSFPVCPVRYKKKINEPLKSNKRDTKPMLFKKKHWVCVIQKVIYQWPLSESPVVQSEG